VRVSHLEKVMAHIRVGFVPSRGHLAVSRDIFYYHIWESGASDIYCVAVRDSAEHHLVPLLGDSPQQQLSGPKYQYCQGGEMLACGNLCLS
jgi:hypothetical protein